MAAEKAGKKKIIPFVRELANDLTDTPAIH